MKSNISLLLRALCLISVLGATISSPANEVNVVRTTYADRWITNLIDVQMPRNHFVDVFRTNFVRVYRTNQVDRYQTNVVDLFATNVITRLLTNNVLVDLYRTNFVQACHTNLKAINLTNWSTVLVFKTNWITQNVTNVVELEMSKSAVPAGSAPVLPAPEAVKVLPSVVLDAVRTGRGNGNNHSEVRISVRHPASGAPLKVQRWKVESEDGSILSFGQDQEFKRSLPFGRYKVEVLGRRDSGAASVTGRAMLTVTDREAVMIQTPLAQR